jgi:hypothetical protein
VRPLGQADVVQLLVEHASKGRKRAGH